MTELIGSTIADRYRFDICLGEGTFAKVYRVHDTRRNVDLAAKVLRPDISHEPTFLERFRREGDVLERLQHPNIVRYYDLIETSEAVFILMDYISGETLQSILYTTGHPLTVRQAFDFLKPLTAALHFAHGEGIIHRDLKPANILIHENGTLFVTDFGIARLLDDVTFTASLGQALGTPLYMAPEQITNGQISAATDIYSLGIILYQMLTGDVPFSGRHPATQGNTLSERITYEHLYLRPAPLQSAEVQIPDAVQEVVLQCLAKDPPKRPHSVRDVYDLMAEALGAAPSELTPHPKEQSTTPPAMTLPEISQFIRVAQEISAAIQANNTEALSDEDENDLETTPLGHETTLEHERPTQNPLQAQTMPATKSTYNPASTASNIHSTAPSMLRADLSQVQAPESKGRRKFTQTLPVSLTTFLVGFILILAACIILALYALSDNDTDSQNDNATVQAISTLDNATPLMSTDNPALEIPSVTPAIPTSIIQNGSLIAFASSRNRNIYSIFVVESSGENERQLTPTSNLNQTGPAWSPDGSKIAFYAYGEDEIGDIYLMDAEANTIINLTNSPTHNDRYVAWSPDGNRLVYHSNRPGEVDGSKDYELYVYDLSDNTHTQITYNNTDDLGPDWSPDGSKIAFHSYIQGRYRIYTVSPDGSNREQVSPNNLTHNAYFPTWSPDGSRIAFHVNIGGSSQIFIMDADGTNLHTLLAQPMDDRFPDWSPDGNYLIFQRRSGSFYSLQIYSFADETVTLLGSRKDDFLPDWQPAIQTPP